MAGAAAGKAASMSSREELVVELPGAGGGAEATTFTLSSMPDWQCLHAGCVLAVHGQRALCALWAGFGCRTLLHTLHHQPG